MFLWLCAHNSIDVKVCLGRRGVVQDEVCPVCCNGAETILHALRDCSHLKHIRNQLGVTTSNYDFWHVNLLDWLSLNVKLMISCMSWVPLGNLFFPLLFGAFGRVGMTSFSIGKVGIKIWLWILCIKLWSIFIVWLLLGCKAVES